MVDSLKAAGLIRDVGWLLIRRPLLSIEMVGIGTMLYAIPHLLFSYFMAHKPGFRLATDAFRSMAHEAVMGHTINIHEVMPLSMLALLSMGLLFLCAGIMIAAGVYAMVWCAKAIIDRKQFSLAAIIESWPRLIAFIPLYLLLSFIWDDVFSLPVSYLDTELGHWILVRNMEAFFSIGLLGIPIALLGLYLYFRFYTYQAFFILESRSYDDSLHASWELTRGNMKQLVLAVVGLRCIVGILMSVLSCIILPLAYCCSVNTELMKSGLHIIELGAYCWISTLCAVTVYRALAASYKSSYAINCKSV